MASKYEYIDHTTHWKKYLHQANEENKPKRNHKKGGSLNISSTPVVKTRSKRKSIRKLSLGERQMVAALKDLRVQMLDGYPYKNIRSQVGMMARGIETSKLRNANTKFYISSFQGQTHKKQEEILDAAFPGSI